MEQRRRDLAVALLFAALLLVSLGIDGYGQFREAPVFWTAVATVIGAVLYLWHGKRGWRWLSARFRNRRWARAPSSLLVDEGIALQRCVAASQRARDSIREAREAVDQAH